MENSHTSNPTGAQFSSFITEAPFFYQYAKSNPNPILITNSSSEIQYVNTAWEHLTGYTSGEVLGKNPRFMSSGKTPPELYKVVLKNLREGRSFESEDFIDRKKDGSEFSIRSTFFPVQTRKTITYFVQVLQDISERREIEKQKDSFISSASHELRTPLSVIMISLDLLTYELGSAPNTTLNILKTLQEETGRLATLLNDLLDVSTMQSGKLHMQKEEHDLGPLLHRIVGELRTTFKSHSLTFEETGDVRSKVYYNEARIAQVLTNLISNAVKYSPQADKVFIHLDAQTDEVVVRIQDFGIGVGEDERLEIFNVFYRAKNRGHIEGTGLGLFITAQIIAAHQGRLWMTSELGKGSIFYFSLPLLKTSSC